VCNGSQQSSFGCGFRIILFLIQMLFHIDFNCLIMLRLLGLLGVVSVAAISMRIAVGIAIIIR